MKRLEGIGAVARQKEKRKRLVHPRQALEAFRLKSLFDFMRNGEATRGDRRSS
ncbi:hypothetical protein [Bacillus sp. SM2101]|uniref:hypothetical protein n=1 Tax=Bacillus sp. SM2101 TaxID=2805366 RepID=UPI001BDE1369|nr:hypothetical protein [Bacillus sp. SM2101]